MRVVSLLPALFCSVVIGSPQTSSPHTSQTKAKSAVTSPGPVTSFLGVGTNDDPVFVNPPDCPLTVSLGGLLNFDIQATGPELGQVVDVAVDAMGLPEFTFTSTPGNPGVASCTFAPTMLGLVGLNTVTFTATDDGTPMGTASITVEIEVLPGLEVGSVFCNSAPNSTGVPGRLDLFGSMVVADGNLMLRANSLPSGQIVLFIAALNPGLTVTPGANSGVLCLSGAIGRLKHQIVTSSDCGIASVLVDMGNIKMNPSQPILAGEFWHFQAWHRDDAVSGSNFSSGTSVMFQ